MSEQSAPPRQRPWGLRHLGQLLLIETALLLGFLYFLAGHPTVAVLALLAGVLLVLLVVPFSGRSMLDQAGVRRAYGRRAPRRPKRNVPDDLTPLAEWLTELEIHTSTNVRGDEIGIVLDGTGWVGVLACEVDGDLISDSVNALDLNRLTDALTCDDLTFAGVQVVTLTVPAASPVLLGEGSVAAQTHRQLGVPAPALRHTWIALRLDPARCLGPVTRRGDSFEGIEASLVFGLNRLQSQLKRAGLRTRPATGAEVEAILSALLGTPGPTAQVPSPTGFRSAEQWAHWQADGLLHSGRLARVEQDPNRAYERLLAAAATAPALYAVSAFGRADADTAHAALRLVTPDPTTAQLADAWLDAMAEVPFSTPGGAQLVALLATLPLGRPGGEGR